jgi:predicted RNA methylase
VPALFDLLASEDDDVAKASERALVRVPERAGAEAIRRFPDAVPPLRSRLCALVGRIAAAAPDPELTRFLLERLDDRDAKTRRRAILALSRVQGDPRVEPALLAAWDAGRDLPEQRALATALGNVGGEAALARLAGSHALDPELERIAREARLKIERARVRREHTVIDLGRAPAAPVTVLLHVRSGLEDVLVGELPRSLHPQVSGRGRVRVTLGEPLAALYRARTFLHLGFPLPAESVRGDDSVDAVVRALTSEPARAIFETFTRGAVRYRIEWASAGRRRSATFRVAERVARVRPELVNDPTGAPWEAVVTERPGARGPSVYVELWPRVLEDPRFSYRRRVLPASSHPTIAAALVRLGGTDATDVVWDPFVGAGTELVERARLGPYAKLFGSDTDARALEAARENLGAAKVDRFALARGDARAWRPAEPVSLVVTNPPLGRRVLHESALRPLFEAVFANVTRATRADARMVFVSPLPEATSEMARAHGWDVRLRKVVDLGGLSGEIQLLVRSGRGLHPRPTAKTARHR